MAGQSEIEWTDSTWNPISGCLMVSPGCTNCYAMRMAARLQAMGLPAYAGTTRRSGGRHVWTGRIQVNEAALEAPLRWRRPKRIFVNSMSDLFQDGVPEDVIGKIWSTMQSASWHSFQILTKRPLNMKHVLNEMKVPTLPNVWLGTSVESADHAERIEHLKLIPAAVRFVSFEPLIGDVGNRNLSGIHWAIVGGESGPGARPIAKPWIMNIKANCAKSGTAFFFKQWGGTNKSKTGRLLDGRTWDDYPARILEAAE